MGSLLLAVAVLLAAVTVAGQGIALRLGADRRSGVAPVLGLALLLGACSLVRLPGHGTLGAAVLVAVPLAAALSARRRPRLPALEVCAAWALGLAAGAIPFLVNGRTGIPGQSLDDDLAHHLAFADALRHGIDLPVVGVVKGYPLGPHALCASLSALTGVDASVAFSALLIVAPALLCGVAAQRLRPAGRAWAVVGGAFCGLAYLVVAYAAEGAFKEVLEALLTFTFAACLADALSRGPVDRRTAAGLGLLAGASAAIYAAPGVAWMVAVTAAAALVAVVTRRRTVVRRLARSARALPWAVAAAVLVVAPQADRLVRFSPAATAHGGSSAVDPHAFRGNLLTALPFREALGVWPQPDFRFPVTGVNGGVLGAVLAITIVAGVLGAVRSVRRGDVVPVAAFLAVTAIWLYTARTQGPYVEAKVLVILAPLAAALQLSALARRRGRRRTVLPVLCAIVVGFGLWSATLPLRAALVGPLGRVDELRSLRPLVGERPVVLLGPENFSGWAMLGARLSATSPYVVAPTIPLAPRPEKPPSTEVPSDFDTLPPRELDRFAFAITSPAASLSVPPPNWHVVRRTASFTLWRRRGRTPARGVLAEGAAPGRRLDCSSPDGARVARIARTVTIRPAPVAVPWSSPAGTQSTQFAAVAEGATVRARLALGPGAWQLVLRYRSPRPVQIVAPGLRTRLPATLSAPGWPVPVGTVHGGRAVAVRLSVARGARLSLPPPATVSQLVAVRLRPARTVSAAQACGRYVDHYSPAPHPRSPRAAGA